MSKTNISDAWLQIKTSFPFRKFITKFLDYLSSLFICVAFKRNSNGILWLVKSIYQWIERYRWRLESFNETPVVWCVIPIMIDCWRDRELFREMKECFDEFVVISEWIYGILGIPLGRKLFQQFMRSQFIIVLSSIWCFFSLNKQLLLLILNTKIFKKIEEIFILKWDYI